MNTPLTFDNATSSPSALPGQGRPARLPRRALHGVVLLDKPLGWSSNDALQKVKRLFRAEKAGHTGTLDPLATGLLPLCFGAATKFSQVALDADKRYTATLKLGVNTTTGDGEGDVCQTREVQVTAEGIAQACAAMVGEIDQMPPMHSALKHEGRALYEYAREGVEIERPTRRITIHAIDILSWHDDSLVIDVQCSKGTYIRTLAEDIGEKLGCGAHLSALRRTGSGQVSLKGAVTLEALQVMTEAERDALLQPPDLLVSHWPAVSLGQDDAARFLTGLRRRVTHADAPAVRVYGPNPAAAQAVSPEVFVGSAHITAGELIPSRLLSPAEVQGLLTLTGVTPVPPS
jgi:tRNA pseudouridine55 synthase